MWWLLVAVLPLFALVGCSDNRETAHRKKQTDSKDKKLSSTRSGKSGVKPGSSKSKRAGKSSRSGKSSKSGARKPSSSTKSSKSAKAQKAKSGKSASKKSSKASKSGRSGKSKSDKSKKSSASRKSRKDKSKAKIDASIKADQKAALLATTAVAAPSLATPVTTTSAEPTTPVPTPAVAAAVASAANAPLVNLQLRLEPSEMNYKSGGGLSAVHVFNDSNQKRAFKVKCSDNQLYRVNPVHGVVEAGQSAKIEVLRQNGSAKVDKLVLVTAPLEGTIDAREAVIQSKETERQLMVVPLLVEA